MVGVMVLAVAAEAVTAVVVTTGATEVEALEDVAEGVVVEGVVAEDVVAVLGIAVATGAVAAEVAGVMARPWTIALARLGTAIGETPDSPLEVVAPTLVDGSKDSIEDTSPSVAPPETDEVGGHLGSATTRPRSMGRENPPTTAPEGGASTTT